MASVRVNNLIKSFGNNTVVDSISFDVAEGEFCILLGPSGCGKTTILRILAGLEQQDTGEVYIADREVSGLTPKERDIAMVFQSYALYPHLNVFENMAFSLMMRRTSIKQVEKKVAEVAALLDISELLGRKPRELSGGQRQRVAIGRAIVRSPRLFLFDEPLSNLDAKLRGSMRIELAKLHQKLKATMIYVTHDQVEAMTLGDKIILINDGIIQQQGSPDDLYNRPVNLFVATFIGSPPINLIRGKLAYRNGETSFISSGFTIPLGAGEHLKRYHDKEVTVGIRPESLAPGAGPISGEVELIEHLGPETLVYVTIHDVRIVAKAPPGLHLKRGERVSLSLSNTGIHFFHHGDRISLP